MEEDSRSGETHRVQNLKLNEVSNKTPKKQKSTKTSSRVSVRTSSQSFLESFKNEWALFWAGLLGDDSTLEPKAVEALTSGQIKEITKALSEQKKVLNQKLESLAKEIDLNSTKLHSMKLAGLESPETEKRLGELNDVGQEISNELAKLDDRLRSVRGQERAAAKLAAAL